MNFITVKVKHPHIDDVAYDEMINIDHIVSIQNANSVTRIDMDNGQWVVTTTSVWKELKEYLTKTGSKVVRIGE